MSIRNFDIDALRTMVEGIDLGSFTIAASKLGRSQSAISMQLKKLEDRSGVQLFTRKGRGLVPTEAGEILLAFARKIVALNDEAAVALGIIGSEASVKLGLPQDFFDIILPDTINAFEAHYESVHVDVRAGRNYMLADDVQAGRVDAAIAFFPDGSNGHGDLIATLPLHWICSDDLSSCFDGDRLPLVLFDHPCLFRSAALAALEKSDFNWRVALTTPSLPGIWAAVRAGQGISLRTLHGLPEGVRVAPSNLGLPTPPSIEVRLLTNTSSSSASQTLADTLRTVACAHLAALSVAGGATGKATGAH